MTETVWPCFHSPNVYGPVPTGVSLANFWTSAFDIPSQMCFGRIGIASAGSKAWGLAKVTTTSSPLALQVFMSPSHCAYPEDACSAIVVYVNTTSSAENGSPSCHVTPVRR